MRLRGQTTVTHKNRLFYFIRDRGKQKIDKVLPQVLADPGKAERYRKKN